MKQTFYLYLIFALLSGCATEPDTICTISGEITNHEDQEIYVYLSEIPDTIHIKADGSFSKQLTVQAPVDAYLKYQRKTIFIYLEPGKDLSFSFDAKDIDQSINFSGDLGMNMQYLHEKSVNTAKQESRIWDFFLNPPDFPEYKRVLDSIRLAEISFLDQFYKENHGLSKQFFKLENTSINYNMYSELHRYPYATNKKYRDSIIIPEDWFDFLKNVDYSDPELLNIRTSRWLFIYNIAYGAIDALNLTIDDIRRNPTYVLESCSLIKEKFTLPEYYDVLTHYFISQYMEDDDAGFYGIEDLMNEYLTNCSSEEYRQHVLYLKNKWNPVSKGKPAFNFTLPNENGDSVSLSDFKGKYVFMDFWTTWCGPCKGDLPYLIKMMDDYTENNIVFLSISCDKDKTAWENMLIDGYQLDDQKVNFDHKTNWVHLHSLPRQELQKRYMVSGYPTYILIDPEGNFVLHQAPRPWEKSLRELIEKQPGF